jgi:phosphoadenosine phosphosulfate reductase
VKLNLKDEVETLQKSTTGLNIIQVFQLIASSYPAAVTFSTSFGNEDQVITDYIAQSNSAISIFTLDTGRLFEATYDVWNKSLDFFKLPIKAYYPDPKAVSEYSGTFGPNAFYNSLALRKKCCTIRKTEQLQEALKNMSIWITGLRAEHSVYRSETQQFEWDETNQVIKYHPLLHWTTEQVSNYIKRYDLPYNTLTDKGFVSIGCEPCTRAIEPGEDFRAGRWWWEPSEKKECGLHLRHANNINNK